MASTLRRIALIPAGWVMVVAALVVLSSCPSAGGSGGEDGPLDARVYFTITTPDLEPGSDGYAEGTATITFVDGVFSRNETVVRFVRNGEVLGARYIVTAVGGDPGRSFFSGVTGIDFYVYEGKLGAWTDPVPPLALIPDNRLERVDLTWAGGLLRTISGSRGGGVTAGPKPFYQALEYYAGAGLRAVRRGEDSGRLLHAEYFTPAGSPFENLGSEVQWCTSENHIPEDYNYDDNPADYTLVSAESFEYFAADGVRMDDVRHKTSGTYDWRMTFSYGGAGALSEFDCYVNAGEGGEPFWRWEYRVGIRYDGTSGFDASALTSPYLGSMLLLPPFMRPGEYENGPRG